MDNVFKYHRALVLRVAGVALLLAVLLLQLRQSSAQKSAAFDETYHLISGYAYLHTGSPRLSWEHPPVPQILAALPLLRRDDIAPFPLQHPGWQQGNAEAFVDEYLWVDNAPRAPDLVWAGRKPLMWLTLGFALAMFSALFVLVGEAAAWIGLVLFVLDPNIIANGRIIGNDLAVAGCMFIAIWRLGVYLRHGTWGHLVLTGLAAGLAIASKLTAIMLGPAFLLIAFIYPLPIIDKREPELSSSRFLARGYAQRLVAMTGMGLIAACTLWAVFGFEVGPLAGGGIHVPAPTYLRGLPRMFQRVARGTPTFLLGRVSDTGWWYYFTVTFLLKTPLPTLLLLAHGMARATRNWRETALWWVPAGLYFIAASASTLQIGYRYILPVLLFSFALAASGFKTWPRAKWQKLAGILLLMWLIFDAVWVFPDHLAYSNLVTGGPNHTWEHFADMNVDWGMDLVALRAYQHAHPEERLYLAYFGSAAPLTYGIQAQLMPGFSRLLTGPAYHAFNAHTPEPGTYAVSATSLHLGLIYEGRDLYKFFRQREPDAYAGRSILIYRVDYAPGTPVDRAVVVGPSVWRQAPASLGLSDKHRLSAKWAGAHAIVLPANGPARYIVEAPVPDSYIVHQALQTGDARPLIAQLPLTQTLMTPQGTPLPPPAAFERGLSLINWEMNPTAEVSPGTELRLLTYWRVEGSISPPLAVFVHVLNVQAQAITQWDGLPVATYGLERGDIIVLEHILTIPQETEVGEYHLQLGLYRPPYGPRLRVAGHDRVALTTLRVQRP